MSKNVSDNNNAAMLLMSHVGDVGDVKYLNTMLLPLILIEIFHISPTCLALILCIHID